MPDISLPTREEFLEQLTSYPITSCAIVDEDISSCSICVRDLVDVPINDEKERAVLLHDTHVFGEECAREWLASANTCPNCRTVLYQQDDDDDGDDDADIDFAEPMAPAFDEEELTHLLWQAGELSTRDPRTEAFGDQEVMAIYWNLWNQWMAAVDENVDGTWHLTGPRSNGVAMALHERLQVRYSWWRHSPQQLNLNIPGRFTYPAGTWVPTERDLRRRVVIDFGDDLPSAVNVITLTDKFLAHAFDDGSNCVNTIGHPAALELFDRTDGLLQNYVGQRIRVSTLMAKMREWVGDADLIEANGVNPHLPPGYTDFLRFVIDETTQTAIRRTRESRLARRARRNRRMSRAPRMSAPSTMM